MSRRIRCGLRLSAAVVALALASACGGGKPTQGPSAARTGPQFDAEKILNVYSWTDYIAPDTVANFERETGIVVRYDTYESNEVLETKLLTGHTNYDIVIPTDTFFERLLHAGVFRRLDPDELTNRSNLDADIMQRLALHDPGNAHGVPYLWSTVGIGYNVAKLRERLGPTAPDSWSVLLEPTNAAKLADCGISVIDSPPDVFAAALLYLGRDPNSFDPRDAADVAAVLMKLRPYIRMIESTQDISDLANGSLCLTLGWSGDILQARARAREAANGVQIAYFLPREGSVLTTDMMGIPADAPHPHNAEQWMNYLMRPDVIAAVTNAVKYPNGNSASLPFVSEAIKGDPSIYPSAAARAHLHAMFAQPPEYSRLMTRIWTRFRTGE
ncbi:MAG: polyamine ABC transporter substrate-binding protein [Steroidobacteraceae bacterium]